MLLQLWELVLSDVNDRLKAESWHIFLKTRTLLVIDVVSNYLNDRYQHATRNFYESM